MFERANASVGKEKMVDRSCQENEILNKAIDLAPDAGKARMRDLLTGEYSKYLTVTNYDLETIDEGLR